MGNLYYKVANTVANAELLDVANVMSEVNKTIRRSECAAFVTETYQNGASWYRVYSDGWCEQGGTVDNGSYTAQYLTSVTFLKPFKNTSYTANASVSESEHVQTSAVVGGKTITTMSVQGSCGYGNSYKVKSIDWFACGYIA